MHNFRFARVDSCLVSQQLAVHEGLARAESYDSTCVSGANHLGLRRLGKRAPAEQSTAADSRRISVEQQRSAGRGKTPVVSTVSSEVSPRRWTRFFCRAVDARNIERRVALIDRLFHLQ